MGKKVLEIICGTYEEYLLGYLFHSKVTEITQSFAAHDHSGSIRSVAYSEKYLASGSTDDRIIVYDLKTRKEHCMLTHHNATINCIQFTNDHSHILSGSSDGILAIVRVGNWQIEKLWEKPHKGSAVIDIAVHASSKLALTLGADGSLCTWNLIKGRQAFVVNLNTKCRDARSLEKILWGPDGVHFILYGGKYTEVWSIDSGGPVKQIEHSEKVISCVWLDEDILLVGYENGQLCKLEISSTSRTIKDAHKSRVKALMFYKKWIISGSSEGEIKVWNLNLKELCRHDTGCRITCLCVVPEVHIKEEEIEEPEEISDDLEIPATNVKNPRGGVVIIEEDDDKKQKAQKKKKKKHVLSDSKESSDVISEETKTQKRKKENNSEVDTKSQNDSNVSSNLESEKPKKKKRKNKS